MTREETIKYAQSHGISVPVTVASPYSVSYTHLTLPTKRIV